MKMKVKLLADYLIKANSLHSRLSFVSALKGSSLKEETRSESMQTHIYSVSLQMIQTAAALNGFGMN